MAFVVDSYVLESVFNKIVQKDGTVVYWRSCAGGDNGYIVLFEDGQHLHTYRLPSEYWK
jgi:hypothetical protein